MKIGMNLCLWTLAPQPSDAPLFARLRADGYEGVELSIHRDNGQDIVGLARALDEAGLERTVLTNLKAHESPVDADPAVRRKAVDALRWVIDASHQLGSGKVSGPLYVGAGSFTGTGPTESELDRAADVLSQAAEHAAAASVTLAIESMSRFETYLINTTDAALSLIKLTQRDHEEGLGLVFDTHHAHLEENDMEAAIRSAGHHLTHVHLSESHRGTLGGGLVQWPAVARGLAAIGYDGWIMVEAFATDVQPLAGAAHVWRDVFESKDELAKAAVGFARDLLAHEKPET